MVNFDHIFIINPSKTFDFGTLYYVLKQINFPESQVYVFGDKPRKMYFKKMLFPYWQLKSITICGWLDKYSGILELKDRYYLIANDYADLLRFEDYIKKVEVLNLVTKNYQQFNVFNYISRDLNYRCVHLRQISHYKSESIWIKNSQ